MPLWPFVMLVAIFLAVLVLPPLVAAYLDYRAERRREGRAASDHREHEARSEGS